MFCDSRRNILKENDIVRFPKLADTYQRIAEEGPDVFYSGSMAQTIVEDIQAAGLPLSPSSLGFNLVRPTRRRVVITPLRLFQVASSPWTIWRSISRC